MKTGSLLAGSLVMGVFAMLCTALVALTQELTSDRIEQNKQDRLLRTLNSMIAASDIDNDLANDVIAVHKPALLNTETTSIYRGRMNGLPVGVIFSPVGAIGYGGTIQLVIGVNLDGTLSGVRVLQHRETPGLGDKIEAQRSDWITGFNQKSLHNPGVNQWKVKRDGGAFDQFTGATVTPRGVVQAVYKTLEYFAQNRKEIFEF